MSKATMLQQQIDSLDKYLRDAFKDFKRRHGKRPDYILVTPGNYQTMFLAMRQIFNSNIQNNEEGLAYRGIPILPVNEGMKDDVIKLVTE